MPRPARAKIVEDEGELGENAKKNKIYEDFLVFRAGNENFINKASQTINDAPKTKHTQTQWTPGQIIYLIQLFSSISFIDKKKGIRQEGKSASVDTFMFKEKF